MGARLRALWVRGDYAKLEMIMNRAFDSGGSLEIKAEQYHCGSTLAAKYFAISRVAEATQIQALSVKPVVN